MWSPDEAFLSPQVWALCVQMVLKVAVGIDEDEGICMCACMHTRMYVAAAD